MFVGLYVPLNSSLRSGNLLVADALKPSVTFEMELFPPTSDMSTTPFPLGPTSMISMSSGHVCARPTRVTERDSTTPSTLATSIGNGYVDALPESGIVTGTEFVNET